MAEETPAVTAVSRWDKLHALKSAVIKRARLCAELTIPSLLPPEGSTQSTELPTPYQSMGARGVNNLASKLLLTLFPPNTPYFRMSIQESALLAAGAKRTEVESALGKIEKMALHEAETKAHRVVLFETIKLLIAAGNALLFQDPTGKLRVHRLDSYCAKRDPMGTLVELVIKERILPQSLPDAVRPIADQANKNPDETVDIYTYCSFRDKKWTVHQEAVGMVIAETVATYTAESFPWLALRWISVPGEDYGRGHVEEFLGDLRSLEALTMAIVEAAAVSSRIIFLTNPNGVTSWKVLRDTPNGGFAPGIEADIGVIKVDKQGDLSVAAQVKEEITARLSYAFLLTAAIQRQAERVTAEELRIMATELEDALGGVYSVLSQELQAPLARLTLAGLQKRGELPKLGKEFKPVITTGLEALGRGHDLNKLRTFGATVREVFGEQVAATWLKAETGITQIATALGLDTTDLVKTQDEVTQEQQQVAAMAAAQAAAPGMATEALKQNGVPQEAPAE